MSFLGLFSFMLFPVLVAVSTKYAGVDPLSLIDLASLLLVLGGTVIVLAYSYGGSRVLSLVKVFTRRSLGSNRSRYSEVVKDLFELSRAKNRGEQVFSSKLSQIKDLFLLDAISLLDWAKNEVSASELKSLLSTRAETFHGRYVKEVGEFNKLRFVPIYLGLLGSILFSGFEMSSLNLLPLGYGLFLVVFFFLPVSEQLEQLAEEDYISRQIVVDGVLLLHENKPSNYIEEKLNSFVLPHERFEHK